MNSIYRYRPFLNIILTVIICPLNISGGEKTKISQQSSGHIYEVGHPFITNYSPEDYNAHPINYDIIDNAKGVIYVANYNGVLEYDGQSWRLIRMLTPPRSLAVDKTGKIYVGTFGDFGHLVPDSLGRLKYISLMPAHMKHHSFAQAPDIIVVDSGVYFASEIGLFYLSKGTVSVWRSETKILSAFSVKNQLYCQQLDVGLMQMTQDSLHLRTRGDTFKTDPIAAILPYKNNSILVATRTNGFFLLKKDSLQTFATDADTIMNWINYSGTAINDSMYSFVSPGHGIIVLDKNGNLLQHLNKANGLSTNAVVSVHTDRRGKLWVALDDGFSQVHITSPLSIFEENSGLTGIVRDIIRYNNNLFVATLDGVFQFEKTTRKFIRLNNIPASCYFLLPFKKSLLVASRFHGVYQIIEDRVKLVKKTEPTALYRSQKDSNVVLIGTRYTGLQALKYNTLRNSWDDFGKLEGINGNVWRIEEDDSGNIWLGSIANGVTRVEFDFNSKNGLDLTSPKITRFDQSHGLPAGENFVYKISSTLVVATAGGLFNFDTTVNRFYADTTIDVSWQAGIKEIEEIAESSNGDIWFSSEDARGVKVALKQPNGSYLVDNLPGFPKSVIYSIYPDSNNIVWFGGPDGLVRYDSNMKKKKPNEKPPILRRVTIAGDSIIFNGILFNGKNNPANRPILQAKYNALRLDFAAPGLGFDSEIQFQTYLKGFDESWSAWNNDSWRIYTNLPAGNYQFLFKARNADDFHTTKGQYYFKVLPPWYLSWWAYFIYVIAILGAFWGIRTYELNRQRLKYNLELEKVEAEKFKELDSLKSRFFANISHEFRTPLTLILGPLQNLKAGAFKGDLKQQYVLMERNASRLLRLINQLLDLSRLESGKLTLQAKQGDLIAFLKGLVFSFESLAKQKNIRLKFEIVQKQLCEALKPLQGSLCMYFDHDVIEKIFTNLLSNAFKFTNDGGEITVIMSVAATKRLIIAVKDTGIGIPLDRLPHIFDRFYQAGNSYAKDPQGSGIGLALTKELVELHKGEIRVKSVVGKGTKFTILLPLGSDHFSEDQIITSVETDEDVIIKSPLPELQQPLKTEPLIKPSHPSSGDAIIVLIVEDNADMRAFIRDQLFDDYQVLEAKDGEEGLEKSIATVPDLIISDVMMPKMDGYQLCEKLKTDERTSHIPVILLTAKSSGESKVEGLELGADDYLIKPFDKKELKIRVKNLVAQRRKLRERFSKIIKLQPKDIAITSADEQFLQRTMDVVEASLSDPDFGVEQFASKVGMSRMQLHRKLKALTDQSANEFIRHFRLKRAAQLLRQKAGNVTEIVYEVGFSSLSHFAKVFKEEFGVPPSEYVED